MQDVLQMKDSVNRMAVEKVRAIVEELQLDGIVTEGKTPFSRAHFNTCFAEIEALLQRAGYHRQLDVVGYQGCAGSRRLSRKDRANHAHVRTVNTEHHAAPATQSATGLIFAIFSTTGCSNGPLDPNVSRRPVLL